MSQKITGQRMCWYCPGKISLGFSEIDQEVMYPTSLRDIVGETGKFKEFWILSCGHRLPKGMPMLSVQEYQTMPDGTIRWGEGLVFGNPRPSGRTTDAMLDRVK